MVRRLTNGMLFVGEVVDEVKEEKPEIIGDQFLVEDTTEETTEETPEEKKPVKRMATTAKRKSSGKTKRK